MTHIFSAAARVLHHLPRALAILMLVGSPLLAIPSVRADTGSVIEAPAHKKKGMGFVLMVSLQRA